MVQPPAKGRRPCGSGLRWVVGDTSQRRMHDELSADQRDHGQWGKRIFADVVLSGPNLAGAVGLSGHDHMTVWSRTIG